MLLRTYIHIQAYMWDRVSILTHNTLILKINIKIHQHARTDTLSHTHTRTHARTLSHMNIVFFKLLQSTHTHTQPYIFFSRALGYKYLCAGAWLRCTRNSIKYPLWSGLLVAAPVACSLQLREDFTAFPFTLPFRSAQAQL